jgi:hypothetical protein
MSNMALSHGRKACDQKNQGGGRAARLQGKKNYTRPLLDTPPTMCEEATRGRGEKRVKRVERWEGRGGMRGEAAANWDEG